MSTDVRCSSLRAALVLLLLLAYECEVVVVFMFLAYLIVQRCS